MRVQTQSELHVEILRLNLQINTKVRYVRTALDHRQYRSAERYCGEIVQLEGEVAKLEKKL